MFNIRFYNETGSITFGGGTSSSPWRLTAAEGLVFCGKTFVSASYANCEGQQTTDITANARTITLSGDMRIEENFAEVYSAALAALEQEGTLETDTVLGKRRIKARCCDFRQTDRKGNYMLFAVQFLCDNPYFEDAVKTEVAVFKEIPMLDSDFSFPGMFSERISRKNVTYAGTAKTEPTFYINIDSGSSGENLLTITNHTSGETLKFNYGAVLGESITVDVENRKIYNANGESLIKYLADDCFFDGFHLYPGTNDIEIINCNMNTGISVICSYSNKYSEAVHI